MTQTEAILKQDPTPDRRCTRCNTIRPYTVAVCPKCLNPEFALVVRQTWNQTTLFEAEDAK